MFTPTTHNTIKYTYQLIAEFQPTNRSQKSTMPKLLATVHGGARNGKRGKGNQNGVLPLSSINQRTG